MNDKQKTLIKELRNLCEEKKTDEFEFSVEIWGVMWMPWTIYIKNEIAKISIQIIEKSDFLELIKHGEIEKVKQFEETELDYPLEIARTKYKIKLNVQHRF